MSKCKITVLRREYYQDLADQYLADPQVGKCPLFKEGQEFILERGNGKDDFWNIGMPSVAIFMQLCKVAQL